MQFVVNHALSDPLPVAEEERTQAVKAHADAPTHQWPLEPVVGCRGHQIDDDEKGHYADENEQMNVEAEFRIHLVSGSYVGLVAFHSFSNLRLPAVAR